MSYVYYYAVGTNNTCSNTSTIPVEIFIAATLSGSIAFALIGGLIGLVCGSRRTTMREQPVTSVSRTLDSVRSRQFELTENVAYASVKHTTT